MEDEEIVGLYWDRDERALSESERKYGSYCRTIARNIVSVYEDAEECVNDTWVNAWNGIPPHRPSVLSVFLGRITRNLAFDMYRRIHRDKRGGGKVSLVLDELAECVSGNDDPEKTWQGKQLEEEISRFLSGLPEEKRHMFILRYWYAYGISEIAGRMGVSENNVSVTLNRIRGKLKTYLVRRGYEI